MQNEEDTNVTATKYYFKKLLTLNGTKLSRFEQTHIMTMYFFTYGLDITSSLTA